MTEIPLRAEPIYLDVDTGVDDALALLLAIRHPAVDVRGVTTVVGNVDLGQVTRNTIQVLDVAGAHTVPVVSGASRPLVAPARSAAAVHGNDGLDVFRRVRYTEAEVASWFASRAELAARPFPNEATALAAHLFYFMLRNFGRSSVPIGDAGCVASLVEPAGLTTERLPVYVETGGRYSRGQTIVDRRPRDLVDRRGEIAEESHVDVARDIDAAYYRQLFRQFVGQGAPN